MTAISTAVGLERKSRVSGYKIKKGFFETDTPNLPQIIAVLGEANDANQGTLVIDPYEFTTAKEVGERYGYGSPLHQIARILRPSNSEGIGGIPTIIIPQVSDPGATPTSIEWTITGTATANATHTVVLAGRRSVDFLPYSYSIVKDDTATQIAAKIADAINSVLGSPVTAATLGAVVTLTTKWHGLTSAETQVRFDIGNKAAGISYSQTARIDGAGAVSLSAALTNLGDTWYTSIINPYGEATLDVLEQANGTPDPDAPTGRYQGTIFKPFLGFFGSTLNDKDDLSAITDAAARIEQVTNVLCPAPYSEGYSWEAATNYVRLFARTMQDTPHLDINNQSLPDMPIPDNGIIGDMAIYDNRDFLVKKGCSTCILENGFYKVQDFVTTYHPDGENPLQYSYCRNLNLDWNVAFSYKALENLFVKDHVLVADAQLTEAEKSIKPREWKAILFELFENLAVRALINDPDFSKTSSIVAVNGLNPDRFDTNFRYKRTGIARIESTDVEAGF